MTKNKLTKQLPKLNEKDRKILLILKDNPEGLRTPTIQKLLNLPSKTLYRHLNKLKDLEILEKISVIWKICQFQTYPLNMTKLLESNTKQLHDISFVVKLIKVPDWWEKRTNNLRKLKEYQFKKDINWGNNPYIQLLNEHFLIHCFKNSLVFINKKKYWGNDTYKIFIEALKDFLEALRYFEEKIKFKFFINEAPQISVKSNHFVDLNKYLSKRCEKKGDTFNIKIDNKLRCLIDMSDPKGTEFINKDYALEDTQRYGKVVEDIIKNNPPTNSQLAIHIAQNAENLGNYAKHLTAHVDSVKELGSAVTELVKQVKILQDQNKRNL